MACSKLSLMVRSIRTSATGLAAFAVLRTTTRVAVSATLCVGHRNRARIRDLTRPSQPTESSNPSRNRWRRPWSVLARSDRTRRRAGERRADARHLWGPRFAPCWPNGSAGFSCPHNLGVTRGLYRRADSFAPARSEMGSEPNCAAGEGQTAGDCIGRSHNVPAPGQFSRTAGRRRDPPAACAGV